MREKLILEQHTKSEIIEMYLKERVANYSLKLVNKSLAKQVDILQNEVIELEKCANFDVMTTTNIEKPVFNRNFWETTFAKENANKSFDMVLADINNLGKINNEQGHNEGDKSIIKCANFLNNYGTVFRLGGDEFVMVFENSDQKQKFEDDIKHSPVKKLFSYGIHTKLETESISEALGFCDKAMYKMKGYSPEKKNSKIQ